MKSKELYIYINKDGNKRYYADCEMTILHRTDGPAVEYADGDKEWYVNGELHRVDGPAIQYASGTKEWWMHGQRHRTDGPAIECASGSKSWYLNGVRYMEKEFEKIMHPQSVELTLDQIAAKFGVDVKNLKIIK